MLNKQWDEVSHKNSTKHNTWDDFLPIFSFDCIPETLFPQFNFINTHLLNVFSLCLTHCFLSLSFLYLSIFALFMFLTRCPWVCLIIISMLFPFLLLERCIIIWIQSLSLALLYLCFSSSLFNLLLLLLLLYLFLSTHLHRALWHRRIRSVRRLPIVLSLLAISHVADLEQCLLDHGLVYLFA